METLIRKYLDGELNEDESRLFLDALKADPDLDREVRALEELVDLGSDLDPVAPSSGFTERVMAQVQAQAQAQDIPRVRVHSPRRFGLLPMAASWVLALGLGYFLSQGLPLGSGNKLQSGEGGTMTITETTSGETSVAGLKMVRLVYSSPQPDVSRVRVAGSFNGWDPDNTPMHEENGHWVATLLLPPDSYEYMFVVDDDIWVTDPLALTTRDDGFGSRNAVLELSL